MTATNKRSRTLFDFAFKIRKLSNQATETFESAAKVLTSTAPDAVTVVEVFEIDSSSSELEAQSQSLPVTSSTQPPPQMKKKKACFLDEWAKTWPWVEDSPRRDYDDKSV